MSKKNKKKKFGQLQLKKQLMEAPQNFPISFINK